PSTGGDDSDGGFIHFPPDADPHGPDADPDAPDAAPRVDAAPIVDGGACNPVVTQFPGNHPAPHVNVGTSVTYETNPPSYGPHYPVWAHWDRSYGPDVLARPYWVHNLEHGGVVFLW